jgi:DNA excision repair protein ERCC-1
MDDDFDDDADFGAALAAVERSSSAPKSSGPSTNTGPAKVVQPKPQALASRQGPSAILVSTRQKGNPILNYIRSLPWEYSDTPADYIVGVTTCALFLSLKYHRLHPEYIYSRIRALGKTYNLRILLTMVDITNHEEALRELSKTSMINNLTLILCWSAQEAGRYLELFKSYEHASPTSIRAHQAESYRESLTEFITTPRSINKTDAASLISNYGTLKAAVNAQPEELALIPGWGEKKVKDWCNAVRENFRVRKAARTGIGLLRNESTMGGTEDGDDSMVSNRQIPIPISMVPSRETSGLGVPQRAATPEPASKRPRMEEFTSANTDSDEEAAIIAAAEHIPVAQQSVARKESRKGKEAMSEGVAAALAKLREKS